MSARKKLKKVSIVIVLVVVIGSGVVAAAGGLALYFVRSSQNQCDNYADQKFGTQDENLIQHDGAYSQCMADKGLGEYAHFYHY